MKHSWKMRLLSVLMTAMLIVGCCGNAMAITFSDNVVQTDAQDVDVELHISITPGIDRLYYGDPVFFDAVMIGETPDELVYMWRISRDGGETWEELADEHGSRLILISTPENDGILVQVEVLPAKIVMEAAK